MSAPEPIRIAAALLATAWLSGPLTVRPALAEPTPGQQLEQVERAMGEARERRQALEREAARLRDEAAALSRRLVRSAAEAQAREAEVMALEERLDELGATENSRSRDLELRRAELAATLAALARLTRLPPQATIVGPQSPADTIRSSQLLAAVIPEVEGRARALKTELAELAALRRQIGDEQARLGAALANLEEERQRLDGLLAERRGARQQVQAESRGEANRLQRLAGEARDLRQLMERLAAEERRRARLAKQERLARQAEADARANERRAAAARAEAEAEAEAEAAERRRLAALSRMPPPQRPDRRLEPGLPSLPAEGRLVGQFGQAGANGLASKGLSIATLPNAQVVAPAAGEVLFAGPFRGYGQLLIIAHGEGYHTLLAGFARIEGAVGQSLLAGEPVGRMGGLDGDAPILYLELRHKGEPVNPVPWLAANERKVSG